MQTPGPAEIVSFDPSLEPLEIVGQLLNRYGDAVRYETRFGPCFLFVHPEQVQSVLHCRNIQRASLVKILLGEGLLASDGVFWKSQRQLMQRHFLPQRIAPFITVMAQETQRTAAQWQRAADAGDTVDVTAAMTRLTLRVVVRTLFSSEVVAATESALCAAVTRAITELGRISWTIFGVQTRLTPGGNADLGSARRVIDSFCYELIAKRRAIPIEQRPADLLTLLLEARTESGTLTDLQLRDEMVSMFVGGHETTALALSWAWKLLSEEPEVQSRLHREVDDTLSGETIDLTMLGESHWTRAVFQEAMRLYPPVWSIGRQAMAEENIGGHRVPKGACVLISPWFTHRHRAFWPDPERFNPVRFLNGPERKAPQEAYLPFGGGRHTCLGMHFGLLEGTLILGKLARRFRVHPLAGQTIRPNAGVTLRQAPALSAHIETRGLA